MSQPAAVGPYKQEESQQFVTELNKVQWEKAPQFDGYVLKHACPVCTHEDGIDVFVSDVYALFQDSPTRPTQFVPCTCAEDHAGRPAAQSGCGRWGMVTVNVPKG